MTTMITVSLLVLCVAASVIEAGVFFMPTSGLKKSDTSREKKGVFFMPASKRKSGEEQDKRSVFFMPGQKKSVYFMPSEKKSTFFMPAEKRSIDDCQTLIDNIEMQLKAIAADTRLETKQKDTQRNLLVYANIQNLQACDEYFLPKVQQN